MKMVEITICLICGESFEITDISLGNPKIECSCCGGIQ